MSPSEESPRPAPPDIGPAHTDPHPESPAGWSVPHCTACARWVYPAADACPECGQTPVPRSVSETGTVFTYTVNHHRYRPEIAVPYAIALVEIDRAPGLRVITEIVGCDPESVYTGMPVRFSSGNRAGTEHPVFTPLDTAHA